jgi:hypothetical protein
MNRAAWMVVSITAVAVSQVSSGGHHAAPICVTASGGWIRDTTLQPFVVVPLPDSAVAYRWPQEVPVDDFTAHRSDSGLTMAQRATVILPTALSIWLVPWRIDDDCHRVAWTSGRFKLPIGDTTFIAVTIRPESSWIGGIPTADLDDFTFLYSPHTELTWAREDGAHSPRRLISTRLYFDAYSHLPSRAAWSCEPRREARAFEEWVASRSDLRGYEPLASIIRGMRADVPRIERLIATQPWTCGRR